MKLRSDLLLVIGLILFGSIFIGVTIYFLSLLLSQPIATLLFALSLFFTNGWHIMYSELNKLQKYTDRGVALVKETFGRTVLQNCPESGEFLDYTSLLHLEFTVNEVEYSQRYRIEDQYVGYYKLGDYIVIGYTPHDLRFIIFNGSPYGHIDPDPDEKTINKITCKTILSLLSLFVYRDEVQKMKIGSVLTGFLSISSFIAALSFALFV